MRQLAALEPAAENRAEVESSAYLITGNAGRLATKELFVFLQKTKMLAGLLVAATLAVAPGVALAHEEAAALTEEEAALTEEAALRTTVLYRTDHSVLDVGFVMMMTASSLVGFVMMMTASLVVGLCSVTPGPGITTLTISEPTTIIPLRSSGRPTAGDGPARVDRAALGLVPHSSRPRNKLPLIIDARRVNGCQQASIP